MNKRIVISLVTLLVSIAFFWLDLPLKLRAVNPAVNYAIYSFFCLVIPISVIAAGWACSKKWLRVLSVIVATIIGLPSGILGILAFDEAIRIHRLGYDPSLEFMKEVTADDYQYRLYRTNCGATCAFGLELRKERLMPLGVKLVRSVWSFYGAENGELALIEGEVQVSYDGFVVKVPK